MIPLPIPVAMAIFVLQGSVMAFLFSWIGLTFAVKVGLDTLFFGSGYIKRVENPSSSHLWICSDSSSPPTGTRGFSTISYSGGMKQRLGIAQALIHNTKLLVLDEPVSALDPMGRYDVLLLIEKLKQHMTVFMSTHILDDIERIADHIVIIKDGPVGACVQFVSAASKPCRATD